MVHIGKKIKEVVEDQGIVKVELGRKLHMSKTNVHALFTRESMDTELLFRISVVLKHNFFTYYYTEISIKLSEQGIVNEDLRIRQELEELHKKVRLLEENNEFMREKLLKKEKSSGK